MKGRVVCALISGMIWLVSAWGQQPVTFTIFFHFTPEESRGVVFRQLIDEYNATHRGEVQINLSFFADWIPLQNKIRAMVAAGTPPDVFYFTYNPNDLSLFASGQLLDLTPYMDQEWAQRFDPADLEAVTYNGKLYAVPWEAGPVLIYYRKSLFEQAGIDRFPKTWDEFFAACEKLKQAGITPVSLFTADDAWHATNFLSYFAAELGGPDVFFENLDSPAIIESARMLQELFNYTTPDAIGGKWAVSVQNFLSGRTAILLDGPWVIGIINGQMAHPEDVEVVPAPVMKEGDPLIVVTDTLILWAASGHLTSAQKEAVVNFLKWWTSEYVVKKFIIDAAYPSLVVKVALSEDEKRLLDPKVVANVELRQRAAARVVQISRVIKPAALNELPRLVEALAVGLLTPEAFAQELQTYNK